MTNLNFKDCNCKDGHNENVCEKSTGECGDCKMGFHGESCDEGNKKNHIYKSFFFCQGLKINKFTVNGLVLLHWNVQKDDIKTRPSLKLSIFEINRCILPHSSIGS